MTDVGKQDMHVSFKMDKIIVTWRRVKIIEKLEDDALVRERKEKQYSQIIPLAEGTSVRFPKSWIIIRIYNVVTSLKRFTLLEQATFSS